MSEDAKKVSLVTKTHKGVVSIIRDLTMEEAEKLAASLNVHQRRARVDQAMARNPATRGYGNQMYSISDGDVVETWIV